ncbi:hypothetical protein TRFO_25503 [Tritrichomonas foetus]|uniref:Saposin B-type domain-containing protein n=1 Tax=Tritrichomonas foetus TaxID=1144522 RepID=A0A1J4K5M0_9EUKA|nr:hypothetical protein TRFO_25503 [Tritrichomonas foetus]|eukprot:OHT06475.1 hypothetical protein TRFO_25503 [Tritrichomonas foetus]
MFFWQFVKILTNYFEIIRRVNRFAIAFFINTLFRMLALLFINSFSISCSKCYQVAQHLKNASKDSDIHQLVILCDKSPNHLQQSCLNFVNSFYELFKDCLGDSTFSPMKLCTVSHVCEKHKATKPIHSDKQILHSHKRHSKVIDNYPNYCKHVTSNLLSLFKANPTRTDIEYKIKSICKNTNSEQQCKDFISLNLKTWENAIIKNPSAKDLCLISRNIVSNGSPSFQDETRPDWSISWEEQIA